MGYNSVLFICNDATSAIEKDPKGWWDKAWDHLNRVTGGHTRQDGEFGHGNDANGFQAVSNFHADIHTLIIAGGNYATVVGAVHVGNKGHHALRAFCGIETEEQQVELMKYILDGMGYTVSKKALPALDEVLSTNQVNHLAKLGVYGLYKVFELGFSGLCDLDGANRTVIKGICSALGEQGYEVPDRA